jgi:signal peptidase I
MARESFSRYQSYTAGRSARKKAGKMVGLSLLFLYLFSLIIRLGINSYEVVDDNMAPNLPAGTRFLATPIFHTPRIPLTPFSLPEIGEVNRGDLVVIQSPYYKAPNGFLVFVDEILRFLTLDLLRVHSFSAVPGQSPLSVKRLIALPGDIISMEDYLIFVKPSGQDYFRDETVITPNDYWTSQNNIPQGWQEGDPYSGHLPEIRLGEDEYWVMADLRPNGLDSYDYGPISRKDILATGILKFWPTEEFGSP